MEVLARWIAEQVASAVCVHLRLWQGDMEVLARWVVELQGLQCCVKCWIRHRQHGGAGEVGCCTAGFLAWYWVLILTQ